MKITRIFIGILLFLVVLFFLVRNMGQPVKVVILDKANPFQSELVIVMVITFALGILIGFAIAVIQVLALKNRVRVLINEKEHIQKELNQLRNLALDEGTLDFEEPKELSE